MNRFTLFNLLYLANHFSPSVIFPKWNYPTEGNEYDIFCCGEKYQIKEYVTLQILAKIANGWGIDSSREIRSLIKSQPYLLNKN